MPYHAGRSTGATALAWGGVVATCWPQRVVRLRCALATASAVVRRLYSVGRPKGLAGTSLAGLGLRGPCDGCGRPLLRFSGSRP